jgi:hypothetical protein
VLASLLGAHEARFALTLERHGENRPLAWQLHITHQRRESEPKPAVDRRFGGPERRDRLPSFVRVVELHAHHLRQHAAPAVRGIDADDGHARARERSSGNGHVEREHSGTADDATVVDRGVGPLEGKHAAKPVEALVGGLSAEVLPDRRHGAAKLRGVPAGAYLNRRCYGSRSRGAYSSTSRRSAPSSAKRTVTTPPGSTAVTTPSPSGPWRTESPVRTSGTEARG